MLTHLLRRISPRGLVTHERIVRRDDNIDRVKSRQQASLDVHPDLYVSLTFTEGAITVGRKKGSGVFIKRAGSGEFDYARDRSVKSAYPGDIVYLEHPRLEPKTPAYQVVRRGNMLELKPFAKQTNRRPLSVVENFLRQPKKRRVAASGTVHRSSSTNSSFGNPLRKAWNSVSGYFKSSNIAKVGGSSFHARTDRKTTIGRSPESTICMPNTWISRQQGFVEWNPRAQAFQITNTSQSKTIVVTRPNGSHDFARSQKEAKSPKQLTTLLTDGALISFRTKRYRNEFHEVSFIFNKGELKPVPNPWNQKQPKPAQGFLGRLAFGFST